tara:strand:+ start:1807 stop:2151 length:345 start_codon:yes stop_codon:yes gene_type:complete
MYQSSSAGQLKDYSMIPKSPDFTNNFNKVTTPEAGVITDKPSCVIINNAGSYKFCYNTTASLAGKTLDPAEYISGSVLDADAGPVKLDIQPRAWAAGGAGAKTGDVTFVYTGVK